ncbi:MAG: 50S ribosomal protein L35 [bacterium]|nr:50S ribosomal protein L35 [bacterium]
MKLKTHKIVSKRIWFTKTGKCFKRKAGQDHFNSRETGSVTQAKRRDVQNTVTNSRNLKRLLPYS